MYSRPDKADLRLSATVIEGEGAVMLYMLGLTRFEIVA